MAENGHTNGAEHPLTQYQVRFQPGVSGNPGGRPKALLSQAANKYLSEIQPSGLTMAEEIIFALCQKARRGDAAAASLLWDRSEGKLTEKVAGLIGHASFGHHDPHYFEESEKETERLREELFRRLSYSEQPVEWLTPADREELKKRDALNAAPDTPVVDAAPPLPVRPVNSINTLREKLEKKLEQL